MLRALPILLLLALAGCAYATPQLDQMTGTTLAQRCLDYEAMLTAAKVAYSEAKAEGADERRLGRLQAIIDYSGAMLARCPAYVPPPDSNGGPAPTRTIP